MIINDHCLKGIGPERILLCGSFACNGGTAPVVTDSRGREYGHLFTVAYAATGQFTLSWPSGYTTPAQPGAIVVSPQWDAVANWFDVAVVGESTLTATTRTLLIQAHRSGTANAPAAGTGARINFMLHVSNNTGK